MMGVGEYVQTQFDDDVVQVTIPSNRLFFSTALCCCLSKQVKTSKIIPRHKLLGYDFINDEWDFGCCTSFIKCCCCLSDFSSLSIKTSDKTPGPIGFPVSLNFYTSASQKFSPALPQQMKEYIFSSLSGISDNAQLMSHMIADGIAEKMDLDFKLTDNVEISAAVTQQPHFELNYGTRGRGTFSAVKFFPGYVSATYGENASCCYGIGNNPFRTISHEAVRVKISPLRLLLTSFRVAGDTALYYN